MKSPAPCSCRRRGAGRSECPSSETTLRQSHPQGPRSHAAHRSRTGPCLSSTDTRPCWPPAQCLRPHRGAILLARCNPPASPEAKRGLGLPLSTSRRRGHPAHRPPRTVARSSMDRTGYDAVLSPSSGVALHPSTGQKRTRPRSGPLTDPPPRPHSRWLRAPRA